MDILLVVPFCIWRWKIKLYATLNDILPFELKHIVWIETYIADIDHFLASKDRQQAADLVVGK